MIKKWSSFYSEMISEVEACRNKDIPEQEQVVYAYQTALNWWQKIQGHIRNCDFKNTEEEIKFYRNIKPKFTGYIEYLMLVNYSLLFIPDENKEIEQIYWEYEVDRLTRFMERNRTFVEYYKSGNTQNDIDYFLPGDVDGGNRIFSKIYDEDSELVTSHDHLVASLLAEEMYHEYAREKLQSCVYAIE